MPNARLRPAGPVITVCQEVSAIVCAITLKMRGGYTVDFGNLPKLDRKTRYVIIGNHQSLLDPFAIFTTLSISRRAELLPLKFMTNPSIYHRWFLKPFAFALGCYPAHIKQYNYHTYGVEGTIKLLKYGYNICIFPEGTRTTQANSNPKSGIVRILHDFPDAKLILAHLEWESLERGKKHLKINFAFASEKLQASDAKTIMEAIYAL